MWLLLDVEEVNRQPRGFGHEQEIGQLFPAGHIQPPLRVVLIRRVTTQEDHVLRWRSRSHLLPRLLGVQSREEFDIGAAAPGEHDVGIPHFHQRTEAVPEVVLEHRVAHEHIGLSDAAKDNTDHAASGLARALGHRGHGALVPAGDDGVAGLGQKSAEIFGHRTDRFGALSSAEYRDFHCWTSSVKSGT